MKNFLQQFRKKQQGFTLMEVLISSSIFVIVVLSSLSIYSIVFKTSQKTIALTRIQQEAQFMIQVLVKKIRTSVVDYDYYADYTPEGKGLVPILVLKDAADSRYYFKQIGNGLGVYTGASSPTEDSDYNIIPATNITIESLEFYINPIINPFASLDNPPTSQPYVMLVMKLLANKAKQSATLNVQQVVPQRSEVN